jgi:antitoxin component of MazEF toxin-antitoxin module
MSEVFKAKLRKIGNSLGIIVPARIIQGLNYQKGDVVNVVIPSSKNIKRNNLLLDLVGIDKNKTPFKREKKDRY